jgi:hypothetical protein
MTADPQRVAQALDMLAELAEPMPGTAAVPTVTEFLPPVIAAAGPGAARTDGTYWRRMAAVWAGRPLDSIASTDVQAL